MSTSEKVWEIPEPLSVREVRMEDGATIILRRHGNPAGTRLVLSHGNGLAIDLYYPFWSLLAGDFDLIMYDLRNHGWNAVGSQKQHTVPSFVDDHDRILEAIDGHFGEKPKIGVFHSVSALAALLSSTKGGEFSGLVLFDPPLCRRGKSYADFEAAAQRMAAIARARTNRFQAREDFVGLLPYSPLFQCVAPGVFDLMARTTLRQSASGQDYELRCPPEYEAQILNYAGNFAVLVDLEALRCPTKVIGADPTSQYSYLPTFELSHMVSVDYDFLPEATHFLQLEKPEECVAAMLEFLESQNLLNS